MRIMVYYIMGNAGFISSTAVLSRYLWRLLHVATLYPGFVGLVGLIGFRVYRAYRV